MYSHTNTYFSKPIIFSTMITVSFYFPRLLLNQVKERQGKNIRNPGPGEGKTNELKKGNLYNFQQNFLKRKNKLFDLVHYDIFKMLKLVNI